MSLQEPLQAIDSQNGWEQYRLLIVRHMAQEDVRWERLEKRLDEIENRVSFWKGGFAVFALLIPLLVSGMVTWFVQ